MIVLGFDPGFSGAMAVLVTNGRAWDIRATYDMPLVKVRKKNEINIPMLDNWIREQSMFNDTVAVLERVAARPGQGVSGMFRFGMSYGILQGLLAGNNVKTKLVTPQSWKKHHGLVGTDKDASRLKVSELFPHHAGLFARKKDVGRADAVLIGMMG